jgi:hypothetical protein
LPGPRPPTPVPLALDPLGGPAYKFVMGFALVLVLALGLFAAPVAAEAQQAKAVPRVAFLGNGSALVSGPFLDAFRVGMRERGYVEGQTVVIESRFADGKQERVQGLVNGEGAWANDPAITAGAGDQVIE